MPSLLPSHPFSLLLPISYLLTLIIALTLPPLPALVPQLGQNNTSQSPPTNLSLILSNTTSTPNPSTPLPICRGDILGRNLHRASCISALNTISHSPGRRVFGDRAFGTYDITLPRRYLSGDGLCAIDIFTKDGIYRDTGTMREIAQAAFGLVNMCVADYGSTEDNEGGYVRDLGENKNLVVVLSKYAPSVGCYGPSYPSWQRTTDASQYVLSQIPVSTDYRVFGPEGEEGVQVVVPQSFGEARVVAPYGVQAIVDVENRDRVTGRWVDLWAGAVAVDAMCIAGGYAGTSSLPGGLSVTLQRVLGSLESNSTAVS